MKLSNKHNYSVTSNVNICYYFADMAISFKYWVQAVQWSCDGFFLPATEIESVETVVAILFCKCCSRLQ